MNRIQLLDHDVAPAEPNSLPAPLTRFRSKARRGVEYSFFVPLHYESNYAYPLVVWLHGPQGDQSQLKQVMPHVSMRNYVGVAPGYRANKPGLVDAAEMAPWQQTSDEIARSLECVLDVVEQAQERFHIARHRVFLAGLDCGGTMAIRLGLAAPEVFAGVVSLGGAFPTGNQPLANIERVRRLPIMIAHGRESDLYPVGQLCEDLRLVHAAGMSLTLRQYDCGHELTTQMLSDLDVWMMELVTGNPSARSDSADSATWSEEWN